MEAFLDFASGVICGRCYWNYHIAAGRLEAMDDLLVSEPAINHQDQKTELD
jgi:tagatose-1,6-bisphosphate aldolase